MKKKEVEERAGAEKDDCHRPNDAQ